MEDGRLRGGACRRRDRVPPDAGFGMTLMADPPTYHEPVMLTEVLAGLAVRPGGRYVDCTVDGGGHAEAILDAASPGGALLGIDADPDAIEMSRSRLAPFGDSVAVVPGNFKDVDSICREQHFEPVNGMLFDLGLSSHQLASSTRGFSFRIESPLDMRFGREGESADYW